MTGSTPLCRACWQRTHIACRQETGTVYQPSSRGSGQLQHSTRARRHSHSSGALLHRFNRRNAPSVYDQALFLFHLKWNTVSVV